MKKLNLSGNWQIAPNDLMKTVKPLDSLVWPNVMRIPDFQYFHLEAILHNCKHINNVQYTATKTSVSSSDIQTYFSITQTNVQQHTSFCLELH